MSATVEIVPVGTYNLDPVHSSFSFVIGHSGVAKFRLADLFPGTRAVASTRCSPSYGTTTTPPARRPRKLLDGSRKESCDLPGHLFCTMARRFQSIRSRVPGVVRWVRSSSVSCTSIWWWSRSC
jgi:hypothetical protein